VDSFLIIHNRLSLFMEAPSCRICLDENDVADFISPCLCKGSMAIIHRKCLDQFRSMNDEAFKKCKTCNFEYVIEQVVDDPREERKRMRAFIYYLVRDISLLFLSILAIILLFSLFFELTDVGINLMQNLNFQNYDWKSRYLASLMFGTISFFAIIGLAGLLISYDGNNFGCRNWDNCDYWFRHNNCNQPHNCGGLCIVLFCILVLFGIIVSIGLGGVFIAELVKTHKQKSWNFQETKKFIVKDLSKVH
jgi:hypothetical protein